MSVVTEQQNQQNNEEREPREQRQGPGRPRDPDLAQQRRESILRQAILHFAKKGFANADMGAIAEAAGCAKGTLYNYFSSKCELFRAAVDEIMLGLIAALDAGSFPDPVDGLGWGVRTFLAYFDAHPEYIELLVQERADFRDRSTPSYLRYRETHRCQAREHFAELMDQGRFHRRNVDRTLDSIGDLLYGTIFTNYFSGRSIPLEQQAVEIRDLLLHGLLTCEASDPTG